MDRLYKQSLLQTTTRLRHFPSLFFLSSSLYPQSFADFNSAQHRVNGGAVATVVVIDKAIINEQTDRTLRQQGRDGYIQTTHPCVVNIQNDQWKNKRLAKEAQVPGPAFLYLCLLVHNE